MTTLSGSPLLSVRCPASVRSEHTLRVFAEFSLSHMFPFYLLMRATRVSDVLLHYLRVGGTSAVYIHVRPEHNALNLNRVLRYTCGGLDVEENDWHTHGYCIIVCIIFFRPSTVAHQHPIAVCYISNLDQTELKIKRFSEPTFFPYIPESFLTRFIDVEILVVDEF